MMTDTEVMATIRLTKHTVRGVIEELEEHFGPSAAFVATKHALALYGALAEMEQQIEREAK